MNNPNTNQPASFAGVDGCQGGWLVASAASDSPSITLRTYRTFAEIASEPYDVIAVDIPIGLPDAGARACDKLARLAIGPRRNSVFPCPVRPVLTATSHAEASDIGFRTDERRLSAQAWAIVPKIAEVDQEMNPTKQNRIIEVHPEVCFVGLNPEQTLAHAKKSPEGLALRRQLLINAGLDSAVFSQRLPVGAAMDDLHDALAALWTAMRFHRGEARCMPEHPETDSKGLRMEMWV
jgi:predicted RNase H-like nuclease